MQVAWPLQVPVGSYVTKSRINPWDHYLSFPSQPEFYQDTL